MHIVDEINLIVKKGPKSSQPRRLKTDLEYRLFQNILKFVLNEIIFRIFYLFVSAFRNNQNMKIKI
jgi:hypothetical protein